MMDEERDPFLDEVAESLRGAVRVDPAFDGRVMAAIRRPGAGPLRRAWRWLAEPRAIVLAPLPAALAAAALVALVAVAARRTGGAPPGPRTTEAMGTLAAEASAPAVVHFVLIAPDARSVTVAGDFNGWSTTATPMQRAAEGGAWSVSVPLRPGLYAYSFVVDGREWRPDPLAPLVPHDDFGKPNSVVMVRGHAT